MTIPYYQHLFLQPVTFRGLRIKVVTYDQMPSPHYDARHLSNYIIFIAHHPAPHMFFMYMRWACHTSQCPVLFLVRKSDGKKEHLLYAIQCTCTCTWLAEARVQSRPKYFKVLTSLKTHTSQTFSFCRNLCINSQNYLWMQQLYLSF